MTDRGRYGIDSGVVGMTDMRREQRRRREEKITIGDWALTVGIFLLLLAIGAMIGYGLHAVFETAPPRDIHSAAQIPEAEKRWLNERFRFHGIYASIEENGEHYFYRDGKKCRL